MNDDRTWKRHVINQLHGIGDQTLMSTDKNDNYYGPIEEVSNDTNNSNKEAVGKERTENEPETPANPITPPQPECEENLGEIVIGSNIRRSTRKRQPPSRYGNFHTF